jgi:lipoate-protein ligase A
MAPGRDDIAPAVLNKNKSKGPKNFSSVEDVFKNRNMNFDDIHKLNYQQFSKPGRHDFKPGDIVDLNDKDSDDEILNKFKKKKSPIRLKNTMNFGNSP